MSGFFLAPQFEPVAPPLFNGAEGDVLTIVGGQRAWGPGGGGVKQGYLGSYIASAPATGVYNNYTPAGFSATVGRLDIDTTSGNVELTGLVAGADGQLLNVSNIGANALILDPLNGGSIAANQFRLPGQMYISPQYDSIFLCYYGGAVNKWVLV